MQQAWEINQEVQARCKNLKNHIALEISEMIIKARIHKPATNSKLKTYYLRDCIDNIENCAVIAIITKIRSCDHTDCVLETNVDETCINMHFLADYVR